MSACSSWRLKTYMARGAAAHRHDKTDASASRIRFFQYPSRGCLKACDCSRAGCSHPVCLVEITPARSCRAAGSPITPAPPAGVANIGAARESVERTIEAPVTVGTPPAPARIGVGSAPAPAGITVIRTPPAPACGGIERAIIAVIGGIGPTPTPIGTAPTGVSVERPVIAHIGTAPTSIAVERPAPAPGRVRTPAP